MQVRPTLAAYVVARICWRFELNNVSQDVKWDNCKPPYCPETVHQIRFLADITTQVGGRSLPRELG